MAETAFLEQLDKVFEEVNREFEDVYEKMIAIDPELEPEFKIIRDRAIQRRQERRDLINRCHPDGSHWPPHPECPACVKLLQRVESKARERCKNPEDEQESEQKFLEVFHEMYGRKPD